MNRLTKIVLAVCLFSAIISVLAMALTLSSRQAVSASATQPPCSPKAEAPIPTAKPTPDRYRLIANAVSSQIEFKETFDRYKNPIGLKSVDEWAMLTKDVYKLSSKLENFSKEISKDELKQHEIGFTETDVRHLRRDALKYTLALINKTAKMNTDNLYCLWEGGCLDKDNLALTIKMVRNELAETE